MISSLDLALLRFMTVQIDLMQAAQTETLRGLLRKTRVKA